MVTTNLYTTISVLSLGLAYAVYVACLCYLRLLQYRADAATVLRRQKANPLKLAHIPDPGGYSFDFDNPRNNIHLMGPAGVRAFNCVLSQGESIGYFVGAVVVNIAVRGPAYGTQEVALLSFVHACARAVWAFGYIIGVMQLRTGAWICTLIANAGLYVLVLEKLGTQKILGA